MSKYFGTDGFRGEANIDLTVEHAMKIGLFLGHYAMKRDVAPIEFTGVSTSGRWGDAPPDADDDTPDTDSGAW